MTTGSDLIKKYIIRRAGGIGPLVAIACKLMTKRE